MTLRSKMITASTLASTLILLILAFVTLQYTEKKQIETVMAQQSAAVSFTAKELDANLQTVKELLMVNAKAFPLQAVDSPITATAFLRTRTGLHKLFNRHLILLSPKGHLIAESYSLSTPRYTNYGNLPFFKQTVASLKPQISAPFPCCESSQSEQHILFSAPIQDNDGKLRAVMVGAFSLTGENLLTRFTKLTVGKGSLMRLIDSRYIIIAHSSPERILHPVSTGHQQLIRDALNGSPGTGLTTGESGEQMYTTVTRLKSVDWVLAASYPQANILEPVKTVRIFFGVAIIASLLALFLVSAIFMGYLTSPLKQFTRHLEELPIKTGSERCFLADTNDELGQMAKTFNELIYALDNQTFELHAQNDSLEKEMGERQKLQEELLLQNKQLSEEIKIRQAVQEELQQEKKELQHYRQHLEELVKTRTEQLELARDAAEAANRSKSVFLANMSHELRTPLNAILGFAQLLGKDKSLPDAARKNLSIINRSGEHLLAMINDILDISKIEAGKIEIKEEAFDLEQTIRDIGEMFRSRGNAKGLQVTFELAEGSESHIRADLGKLRQILINVMGNAVKFTEEGGIALRVRTLPDKPFSDRCLLHIEIQDTGTGIPADKLETIFEPFSQAKIARDTQKGTGLGLAISRSFVQMMGGDITVSSTVGKGSCFSIKLTVKVADPEEIPETESVEKHVIGLEDGQPEWRILIVDDIPDNIKLLEALFETAGLTCRTAVNGLEALKMAEEWRPHFIWMDMRMPVMDGYEATSRIRELPGSKDIKIFALTASAFKEQESKILAAGCNGVLHKPFRQNEIFIILEQQLGIRFRYSDTEQVKHRVASAPTKSQLAELPEEYMNRLLQAAKELDKLLILEIAAFLSDKSPDVAGWLNDMAVDYRFEDIETVLLTSFELETECDR
jgi:signal transduction histidine kinase/CheY-like chemotaxis protein